MRRWSTSSLLISESVRRLAKPGLSKVSQEQWHRQFPCRKWVSPQTTSSTWWWKTNKLRCGWRTTSSLITPRCMGLSSIEWLNQQFESTSSTRLRWTKSLESWRMSWMRPLRRMRLFSSSPGCSRWELIRRWELQESSSLDHQDAGRVLKRRLSQRDLGSIWSQWDKFLKKRLGRRTRTQWLFEKQLHLVIK